MQPFPSPRIAAKERGPSSDQSCEIAGPGDPGLTGPSIDVFLTRDAAWNPLYTINAPRAGTYEITCSSQGPSRYAIGDPGGLVTLTGWLIVAVLLPVLGVGLGGAVVLVTVLRRRGHRKRLLAERSGSGSGRG
jgi:hypothetical protein